MSGTGSIEQSGSCTEASFHGPTPPASADGPASAPPEPPWLDELPLPVEELLLDELLLEGLPLPVEELPLEGPLPVEELPLLEGLPLPVEELPLEGLPLPVEELPLDGMPLLVEKLPLPGRLVLLEAAVLPKLLPPERVSPELDAEPLSFGGPIGPATAPLHPDPKPLHTVSDKSATQDNVDFILNLTAKTVLRPRRSDIRLSIRHELPCHRASTAIHRASTAIALPWSIREAQGCAHCRGLSIPAGIAVDGIAVDGISNESPVANAYRSFDRVEARPWRRERRGPGRCGSDGLAVGYRDAAGL
jgi:hypothetical protein